MVFFRGVLMSTATTQQQRSATTSTATDSKSLFPNSVPEAVEAIKVEGQKALAKIGEKGAEVIQGITATAKAVIDEVRSNRRILSESHTSQGEGVKQLQTDLNAAVDKLAAMGIKISVPKADVSGAFDDKTTNLLKAIQKVALIDENGNVYAKGADGKARNVMTGEVYSGNFKGLVADGAAGPRTYGFLDALLRGKQINMENFRVVTHGIWDISQVPEGYDQSIAGDRVQYGTEVPSNIQIGKNPAVWEKVKKQGFATVQDVLEMGPSAFMQEAGREVVKHAQPKSIHMCLGYVDNAFRRAGLDVPLGPSGKSGADYAIRSGKYLEVKLTEGREREEIAMLANVPGVLISMQNAASYGGHGHAVMTATDANGRGIFVSDFNQGTRFDPYANQKSDKFRVAIPLK